MESYTHYIERHQKRFLKELFDFLRIPSISMEKKHAEDMERCAEWLREALLASGADHATVMPTWGSPVVYGEKIVAKELPTVLVYGHYDVMPVDPLDAWKSPPFEPQVRDGRIWGRGANDDKGQLYMHVKAMETLLKTDGLPCNVKFMIEGEEETGSTALEAWCAGHKEMLDADVILVSDTGLLSRDTPSITCGLRGLCYMEVEVTGPSVDLHSGLYGGAVANPINVLAKMIASLTDEDGRITVPGFYDDVQDLTLREREAFGKAPFSEDAYKKAVGVCELAGEKGYTTPERTGIRPSLDVNGIRGGYTEEGSKTIIPSKAHAKISMRLVPDQDYRRIGKLFADHLEKIAPPTVTVKVKALHGGYPYVSPTDLPGYRAAEQAMTGTFGKAPFPFYSGGSIPVVSTFEKILGTKSILLGFGLREDTIHSPNESFALSNFYRGIETIVLFHRYYAKLMKK